MRKFYQIYQDGFYWREYVDDVIKIASAIKEEFLAVITNLEDTRHQYIIRFRCFKDNDGSVAEEVKIGSNFVQVSSATAKQAESIFSIIERFIPIEEENYDSQCVPF